MSNDISVTVRGFTGTGPELRHGSDGNRPWTQFRLASTPSVRDADGMWRDGSTTWVTVKAFGRLAENVCTSVRKPDPLVVTGRLRTEEWTDKDGNERSTLTLIADAVGHDLTFGRSHFARVARGGEGGAEGSDGAERADGAEGADGDGKTEEPEGQAKGAAPAAAGRTHLGEPVADGVSRDFQKAVKGEPVPA